MPVKIFVHPFLNEGREIEVTVDGQTVGDCLRELTDLYPQMKERIFDRAGRLRGYIEVLVGLKPTYPLELSYPVQDGDTIHLIVFLSGG